MDDYKDMKKLLLFLVLALTNVPVHAMFNWDAVKNRAHSFLLRNNDKVAMGVLGIAAALTLRAVGKDSSCTLLAGSALALSAPFIIKNYGSSMSKGFDRFYNVSSSIVWLACALTILKAKFLAKEAKIQDQIAGMVFASIPMGALALLYEYLKDSAHFDSMANNPVIAIKKIEPYINLWEELCDIDNRFYIDSLTVKQLNYLTNSNNLPLATEIIRASFDRETIRNYCDLSFQFCQQFADCEKNLNYCDQETRNKYMQLHKQLVAWYNATGYVYIKCIMFREIYETISLAKNTSHNLNNKTRLKAADRYLGNFDDKGHKIIRAIKNELQREVTKLLTGKRV